MRPPSIVSSNPPKLKSTSIKINKKFQLQPRIVRLSRHPGVSSTATVHPVLFMLTAHEMEIVLGWGGWGVTGQRKRSVWGVGGGWLEGVQKTFCNPVTTKFSLVFSKHVDIAKITHFPTRPCPFDFYCSFSGFYCENHSFAWIGQAFLLDFLHL